MECLVYLSVPPTIAWPLISSGSVLLLERGVGLNNVFVYILIHLYCSSFAVLF